MIAEVSLLWAVVLLSVLASCHEWPVCSLGSTDTCFAPSVPRHIVCQELQLVVMRCVVRNLGGRMVTWMKNDGTDIPLTVGRAVFTPDSRVAIDADTADDEWRLLIRRAQLSDSGRYLCHVSSGGSRPMVSEFALLVMDVSKKSTSNVATNNLKESNATIEISGPSLAETGNRQLSLICTAAAATQQLEEVDSNKLIWRHRGADPRQLAGIDVANSRSGRNLISVLTIDRVRMEHQGDWACCQLMPGLSVAAVHWLSVREKPTRMLDRSKHPAGNSAMNCRATLAVLLNAFFELLLIFWSNNLA